MIMVLVSLCASKPPFGKESNIVIVGAGVSGVHMGYLLQTLGYKVTLLEKQDRYGGNSHSLEINGVWHDDTVKFTTSLYVRTRALLQEFFLELSPPISPTSCIPDDPLPTFDDWAAFRAYELFGIILTPELFLEAVEIYSEFFESYFVTGQYLFPSQTPSPEALEILSLPLGTFLQSNGMSVLVPFFEYSLQAYGYGLVDNIPVFYAFTFVPPSVLANPDLRTVRESFANLFQRMGRDLNIRLNVTIQKVYRLESKVIVLSTTEGKPNVEVYDFIILACGLQNTAGWLDVRKEESQIISYFVPNPTSWGLSIISSYDWGTLPNGECYNFYMTPSDGEIAAGFADVGLYYENLVESPEVRLFYQIVNGYTEEEAISIRDAELSAWFGVKDKTIIEWVYGKTYSPEFTNNGILTEIPWKAWNLQGKYRTWYIGASVSFDSVEVMIDYNQQLVDTFLGITSSIQRKS